MIHSLFILSLVYVSCKLLWRLYLSPLRSFRGPALAASTNLYRCYYDAVLQGRFLQHLKQLHDQYGTVVRVAPNYLHFNSPTAYFDIYKTDSSFTKDPELYSVFGIDDGSVGLIDVKKSQARREALSPFFSRRAILNLVEGVIQVKIDKFIEILKSYPADRPANAHYGFRCLTLDVIWTYCFAEDFGALDAANFMHPIIVSIQTQIRSFWTLKYIPFLLKLILVIPDKIFKHLSPTLFVYLDSRRRYTTMVDNLLADPSVLHDTEQPTIFNHLISPQHHHRKTVESNPPPSRKALIEEAMGLIQAGSDTVANTCTVGIFHILNNSSVHKRLFEELQSAWPDSALAAKLQTLEKLPYLTAVIKESLRLSTGVVTPLARIVGPSGSVIGGCLVPAGTMVAMSATFLHFDEELFPEPDRFIPERWLDNSSNNRYLVPFSRGPRMCLGSNLAWAELYLVFANVIRKLDLTPSETTAEDFRTYRELFVPVYDGQEFHIRVKPRAASGI